MLSNRISFAWRFVRESPESSRALLSPLSSSSIETISNQLWKLVPSSFGMFVDGIMLVGLLKLGMLS